MSQNSTIIPTTGTLSGLTMVNDVNAALDTILSLSSGATAPSPATTGMLWYNTTAKAVQQYDGANWNTVWGVDATNHLILVPIGGGSGTIASATTTSLGTLQQSYISITGTTTITSFGSNAAHRHLRGLVDADL